MQKSVHPRDARVRSREIPKRAATLPGWKRHLRRAHRRLQVPALHEQSHGLGDVRENLLLGDFLDAAKCRPRGG